MPTSSFKTKKGYCHFNGEAVVINRSSTVNDTKELKVDFWIIFFLVMFGISIIYGISNYTHGSPKIGLLYCIASTILALNIVLNWRKNKAVIIPYNSINMVKCSPAQNMLSPSYFTIHHTAKNKTKRHFIPLSTGKEQDHQFQKAKRLFTAITKVV